jgi:F0F1-type ATP synthase assembly protein I
VFVKAPDHNGIVKNDMFRFEYKKNRIWAENLQIVSQIGLTMAGCIIFCFFVGRLIDGWLGTRGVFITIFTILGVVGGANVVYRQILDAMQPRDKNNGQEESDGSHPSD